jgi:hypothetical protein
LLGTINHVSDCIDAQQFVLNPQKYGQRGWQKNDSAEILTEKLSVIN